MDYVYAKLNNKLVDVNRIEYIHLQRCSVEGSPISTLKIGDYYLETKVYDSDRAIYTDLSPLNEDTTTLSALLSQEVANRIQADAALQESLSSLSVELQKEVEGRKADVTEINQTLSSLTSEVADLDSTAIKHGKDTSIVNELQTSLVLKDTSSDGAASLYGTLKLDTSKNNGEVGIGFSRQGNSVTTIGLQYNTTKPAILDTTNAYGYGSGWRNIAVEDQITEEKNRALQAEGQLTASLDQEKSERLAADDALSTRIGNLEGKTTRLYYGEGTLSTPTAADIQSFIDSLEVAPPYTPPYSGIAVVVKLTDEGTYHIWHYYANLSAWKDDGVDLVNTFTNDLKGIIQGTESVGYISALNGFGKVNGWEDLVETISNNYSALSSEISKTTEALNDYVLQTDTKLETIDTDLSSYNTRISTLEKGNMVYSGSREDFINDVYNSAKIVSGNYISNNDYISVLTKNPGNQKEFLKYNFYLTAGSHNIIYKDGSVLATFDISSTGNYNIYFKPDGDSAWGGNKYYIEPISNVQNTLYRSILSDDYYIRGTMNNWGTPDDTLPMYEKDSIALYYGIYLPAATEFKIYNKSRDTWYGTSEGSNYYINNSRFVDVAFDTISHNITVSDSFFSPYYIDVVSKAFRAVVHLDDVVILDMDGITIYSRDAGGNVVTLDLEAAIEQNKNNITAATEDIKTLSATLDSIDTTSSSLATLKFEELEEI